MSFFLTYRVNILFVPFLKKPSHFGRCRSHCLISHMVFKDDVESTRPGAIISSCDNITYSSVCPHVYLMDSDPMGNMVRTTGAPHQSYHEQYLPSFMVTDVLCVENLKQKSTNATTCFAFLQNTKFAPKSIINSTYSVID